MKTKEKKLISLKGILATLSDDNVYLWINEQNPNDVQLYYLEERGTDRHFTLPSLNFNLTNNLKGDVEFQRDSDDHKSGENEDFVLDYITGHQMGDITLWKHPKDLTKWIINGKHRLTALQDFYNSNLILKGRYAKRFWTHFLPEIVSLINKGNVDFNKKLLELSNGKYPQVKYKELPVFIQEKIISSVAIGSTEVEIVCKNIDGSIRNDGDEYVMKEIIWNKFFNMNNNIAVIKVEDTFWASLSHYNRHSKRMSYFTIFEELFNIKPFQKKVNGLEKTSLDEYKKMNEMLISMMYFIDGKHTWNGSTKALSKKVNQLMYRFQNETDESRKFVDIFTNQIQKNYNKFYVGGDSFNLSDNVKNIRGNLINIRYFTYFLYMLHKIVMDNKYFALYSDTIPTPTHKAVVELASKIITSSNFSDTSEIDNNHAIYQNGLGKIYEQNTNVFVRFNEYRKSQRTKEQIDTLMFDLFNVCLENI